MNAISGMQTYQAALHQQVSALVESARAASRFLGICIAVSTPHGAVEVASGVRSVRTQEALGTRARFHLHGIVKLLLSIVVLEQAQRGKVNLAAPLGEALAELVDSDLGRDATLAHLLSHTAGYRSFLLADHEVAGLTLDRLFGKLKSSSRLFQPGRVFNYEHTGAVLAAEILRRVTGEALENQLFDVCTRLGIEHGSLSRDQCGPDGAGRHHFDAARRRYLPMEGTPFSREEPGPSTGFWCPAFSKLMLSVGDLLKIAQAPCGWVGDSLEEPALSASVRGLLIKPVVRLPPYLVLPGNTSDLPTGYSLGACQYDGGWQGVMAGVGGQCVALRYHPGLQIAIAAGMNAPHPLLLQSIVRAAGLIASGEKPPSPGRPSALPGISPDQAVGHYENGGSRFCDVRADGSMLAFYMGDAASGAGEAAEIVLDTNLMTLSRGPPGAAVAFLKSADDGAITGLMLGLNAYRRTPGRGS